MTEYLIALTDLLEAEGRLLRLSLMRTGMGLAILVTAGLLLLSGLAFCLWGAYQGVAAHLGATSAALLIGALTVCLAGVLAWTALRLAR